MMDDLDDLFASAKRDAIQPSAALMARVLADATREQPKAALRVVPKPGFWAALAAVFGGGGVLAGVGSAAVAGLVLGFVQPVGFGSVTDLLAADTLGGVEFMPGIDALLAEE